MEKANLIFSRVQAFGAGKSGTTTSVIRLVKNSLISGIDSIDESTEVSIPLTQFPLLIAISFKTTSLIRKLLVAQIFYLI